MRLLDRFDVLTVCSEDDRRYLGGQERIHVIPNGSLAVPMLRRTSPALPRIGFIGNCGYMPNEQGLKWFISDIWPLIKRESPNAQLRLVGSGSDGYLAKLAPDITGLGWLKDPSDEISTWSAMVVPIEVGSGTRVKVADGFARKCPVVSTTLGAFGYDVENGKEILLADRADEFASACISLLSSPQLGEELAERAHTRFLERWTWDSFETSVGEAVQQCLSKNARA
jgi:glycosyltransferase involved in cell wall biosynthesis